MNKESSQSSPACGSCPTILFIGNNVGLSVVSVPCSVPAYFPAVSISVLRRGTVPIARIYASFYAHLAAALICLQSGSDQACRIHLWLLLRAAEAVHCLRPHSIVASGLASLPVTLIGNVSIRQRVVPQYSQHAADENTVRAILVLRAMWRAVLMLCGSEAWLLSMKRVGENVSPCACC